MIYTVIAYQDARAFLCRRGWIDGNVLLRPPPRFPTIWSIQRAVSAYYRLQPADMTSACRAREVVRPRQVAMYLSRKLSNRSFPEIGRRFGNRDHTTVMHAIRLIDQLRSSDTKINADIIAIEREIAA